MRLVRPLPLTVGLTALAGAAVGLLPATAASAGASVQTSGPLGHFKHLVVIYEENHSFDNLYGQWGNVGGESVDGLPQADAAHSTQVRQDGTAYRCLLQKDVNLTTPPQDAACGDDAGSNGTAYTSHFFNTPFTIDDYIKPSDTTCPAPGQFAANGVPKGSGLPGGCTRDIVHRFYQEQYQLDGGKQDRYTTGSDAAGLTQGTYDSTQLPIYTYLHGDGAPHYVIADHFFQAAFGGSFLNHQYLVAAQAPQFAGANNSGGSSDLHSIVDSNGFPNAGYPLYKPTSAVKDAQLTQQCGLPTTNPAYACGDYAVNTIQPTYQPFAPGTSPAKQLPPVDDTTTAKNIGDRLSDKGVSWAWFSGGWDNAAGVTNGPGWTNGSGPDCSDPNASKGNYPYCPDKNFQFHHQPLNYFARYAPGTPDRAAHLKDEADFLQSVHTGTLPSVSFVKPIGEENEHPGYASESQGSSHLVDLLKAITSGPEAGNTLVVVTYDEFGGQWDHVPPPGQGTATVGPHDLFGPGTRIPALVVGRSLTRSGVDHTVYDTTSIMRTIEQEWGLAPVATRDATVNDLGPAVARGESAGQQPRAHRRPAHRHAAHRHHR